MILLLQLYVIQIFHFDFKAIYLIRILWIYSIYLMINEQCHKIASQGLVPFIRCPNIKQLVMENNGSNISFFEKHIKSRFLEMS